jgi:hypothetical protein
MFIQALESMGKVTGATVAMHQEIFKKWIGMFPGMPGVPIYPQANQEQMEQFQKKWAETASELFRRQKEVFESQFKSGMENIEMAFKVAEAKNPEEVRAKTIELWRKCFDSLRQVSEAQLRETQVATEKLFAMFSPPRPAS